jgi:hypothetical protein
MGIVRPVNYSKKELAGLSDAKKKKLRTAILRHLDSHKGIRRIVRQKTKSLHAQLKKD